MSDSDESPIDETPTVQEPIVETPVAAAAPDPIEPQRAQFTGDGREYFQIWIVNLLLTVATLGVYSAWAKVRRLQYFHRHTRLAGAGFDYHGRPIAILKGRIVGLIVQQALAMGVISFLAGLALIHAIYRYFPRRVVLETPDAAALFGAVLLVCLVASALGVRAALKIDPAAALAG